MNKKFCKAHQTLSASLFSHFTNPHAIYSLLHILFDQHSLIYQLHMPFQSCKLVIEFVISFPIWVALVVFNKYPPTNTSINQSATIFYLVKFVHRVQYYPFCYIYSTIRFILATLLDSFFCCSSFLIQNGKSWNSEQINSGLCSFNVSNC